MSTGFPAKDDIAILEESMAVPSSAWSDDEAALAIVAKKSGEADSSAGAAPAVRTVHHDVRGAERRAMVASFMFLRVLRGPL